MYSHIHIPLYYLPDDDLVDAETCWRNGNEITHTHTHTHTRRGADKSLDRPTSRCRRTESILSLERGVRSCAEL